MQFIVETFGVVNLTNACINGYSDDSVLWYFSDSTPDQRTMMYDHSDDRCHGYCPWALDAPSFFFGRSVLQIATYPAFPDQVFIRGVDEELSFPFLCEYNTRAESIYDLFIPSQEINQDWIKIYHNSVLKVNATTVTMTDTVTGQDIIATSIEQGNTYSTWRPKNTNQYLNSGTFKITVETANGGKCVVYYETKPYHIDFVNMTQLSTVYITGTNVASMLISKKVKVTFGGVSCNPVLSSNNNEIKCKFEETNTTFPYLPLKVTVYGVSRTTYKYPFGSTPSNFGLPENTKFWMNYESTSRPDYFKVTTGPTKDEIKTPYHIGAFPTKPDPDLYSYVLSVPSFNVTTLADFESVGMIVEMGGYEPYFEPIKENSLIDGINTLVVYNMIPSDSYQKIYINQDQYRVKYIYGDLNKLQVDLSNTNEGGPFTMRVSQYNGKFLEYSSSNIKVSFQVPTLESVSPAKVPFSGGPLVLQVANIPKSGVLSVNLVSPSDDQDHFYFIKIGNGKKSVYHLPPFYELGLNNTHDLGYKLSVRSKGFESNSIDLPIVGVPTIQAITSLTHGTPGDVTITGTNLCIPNATVTIEGVLCQLQLSSSLSADCTRYVCTWNAEPPQIDPFTVKFEIKSFSTSADIFYYNNDIACPAGCSDNGICDKTIGVCSCYSGFASYNCSLSVMAPINQPVTDDHIETRFQDNSAKFTFRLHSLIYGKEGIEPTHVDLANGIWRKVDSVYSSREYSFEYQQSNGEDRILNIATNYSTVPDRQMFGAQKLIIDPYSLNFEVMLPGTTSPDIDYHHLLIVTEWTKANSSLDSQDQACQPPPAYVYGNDPDRLQVSEIQEKGLVYSTRFSNIYQHFGGPSSYEFKASDISILNPQDHPSYYANVNKSLDNSEIQLILVKMPTYSFRFFVNVGMQKVLPVVCPKTTSDNEKWKIPVLSSAIALGVVFVVIVAILIRIKIVNKREKTPHSELKLTTIRH
eukprot:gene9735-11370_t